MRFFNSSTKNLEDFKPSSNSPIRMYTCGPTVYDSAHIGNLRSFLFADLVRRALVYEGFDVDWVMNITDVDDKTIKKTIEEFGNKSTVAELRTVTDRYTSKFMDDLAALNISTENIRFIHVSEVISEIIMFIEELVALGLAYKAEDGSWYFSIEKYQAKFDDYGKLVGDKFLEGKKIGVRVKVDSYDKENLSDFALWKAHTTEDAEIFWDSPTLGRGRPGWHIECSAINLKAFGRNATDIHTGGVDLIFPHHSNEIAQSQPLYNPFVRLWLHSEHLLVSGAKMAKSDKNFFTLDDLGNRHKNSAIAFRYLMLQANYRSTVNFTWDSLEAAFNALGRLTSFAQNKSPGKILTDYVDKFKTFLEDDLNTSACLSVVWDMLRDQGVGDADKLATLFSLDEVLGLGLQDQDISIPDDILALAEQRQLAKKSLDFDLADQLRTQILSAGYEINDTKDQTYSIKRVLK